MKYSKLAVMGLAMSLLAFSCTEADKFDYNKEVLLMSGTDKDNLVKFVVEGTPSTYPVTVSATGKVSEEIKVSVKIDNSLVEKYNSENKTSYYALPESAINLDSNEATIQKGKASSSVCNLSVVSTDEFKEGRTYVIPVTITDVKGNLEVLESSRTIYLRVSRIIDFHSMDLQNTSMYSNFIFEDDKKIDLPTYTYEVKCYIEKWHPGSEPISRMCQWCGPNEEKGNMLRFGENGQDINSLQWITPKGGIISNTRFATQTWYSLAFVYDGSALSMYVNGVKDCEMTADDAATIFQRVELGMSWGGYGYKQRFLGRIAEMRVWDRPLSASEIQIGLCGVDPESNGLRAYWKFNDGEGHIFSDATGNGYDIDWSKTCRDVKENGVLVDLDNSSYLTWVKDDNNKCAN